MTSLHFSRTTFSIFVMISVTISLISDRYGSMMNGFSFACVTAAGFS
jgi:hypothetical protein